MIRFSFAFMALLLMLMAGCVYHRNDTARSESHRSETTRTLGNAQGAGTEDGSLTKSSETVKTQHESITTEESNQ